MKIRENDNIGLHCLHCGKLAAYLIEGIRLPYVFRLCEDCTKELKKLLEEKL